MYAYTYIHTYIQMRLTFYTSMWGSLRLAPIKLIIMTSHPDYSYQNISCYKPQPPYRQSTYRRLTIMTTCTSSFWWVQSERQWEREGSRVRGSERERVSVSSRDWSTVHAYLTNRPKIAATSKSPDLDPWIPWLSWRIPAIVFDLDI